MKLASLIPTKCFIFLSLLLFGGQVMAERTEKPKYTVIDRFDNIEIREYEPMIQAVTIMDNNYGFQRLANFIFGQNDERKKIAMTSPVTQQETSEGWQMSFMMPSQYALEDLPEPIDNGVKLRRVPAKTVAVISFSGWANIQSVTEHRDILLAELKRRNLEVAGPPIINQYDNPWVAPDQRTNEVQFELISASAITDMDNVVSIHSALKEQMSF